MVAGLDGRKRRVAVVGELEVQAQWMGAGTILFMCDILVQGGGGGGVWLGVFAYRLASGH